ncbi:hypothetical protein BDQ17DRAFT_1427405 [Cyathus striatus]|nr:hypothetical protein BDQ17DRAFT_1427405 [Cyathus striatus]
MENFVDTGEVLYVKCIASLIGERRNLAISITDNIIQFWAGALMENSVQGNHIYLSNEKSQVVFLCILKQISELSLAKLTNSKDGIDIGHSFFKAFNIDVEWYPLILEYLLKRIKPSFDFELFIQVSHLGFGDLYLFLDFLRDTLRSEGFKMKIRYNRVEKNMLILVEAVVDYLKQCDSINKADVPCIKNNSQFQVTGSQELCPQPLGGGDQEVQEETMVHGNVLGPASQADSDDTVGQSKFKFI